MLIVLLTTACGAQIGGENWPGLSADSDTLYFASGTELFAIDVETQQIQWRLPAVSATAHILASPEVGPDRVYVGDYGQSQGLLSPSISASIYSIGKNAIGELSADGSGSDVQRNAEVASDRIVSSPLLVEDTLFVGTANNHLLALDAASLDILWGDIEPRFEHSLWGQPAYADGIVVATSLDTTVRAFDADNGDRLWMQTLGGAISAGPVIVDNTVFVAGFDALLHAFDLQSGEALWQVEATNWIWNAPAVGNGTLFFGDTDGVVYAVDAASGAIEWQQRLDGVIQASPVVADDQLIVPIVIGVSTDEQSGKLFSLSTVDGSLNWQQDMSLPTFATPVVVQDNIVLVLVDLNRQRSVPILQQFNLASGSKGWTWSVPE